MYTFHMFNQLAALIKNAMYEYYNVHNDQEFTKKLKIISHIGNDWAWIFDENRFFMGKFINRAKHRLYKTFLCE